MKKPIALMIGEWLSSCPRWQLFFVFAVFGLTVYAGAILHPFVHDDIFFLVENPIFKHFDLQKIFLHPLDMSVISVGVNAYYRPLLDVVNYAQYQAYGFDPHAFHLFNIILHIINSFLVFNLLVRILRLCPNLTRESGRWMALFASVIFMIHPVQTQAVDCVSGISNLLFVFFGLLAFLMYLEFRQENASIKTNILYVLSLITLMLALLSKEQALVFPLLAAWFEVCYFRNSSRTSPGKAVLCVGGWLAMAIAYVLWKKSLMGSEPLLGGHLFTPEFWLRAAHIPQIILINISLILAPHEFHYFRSVDILTPYVPAMIVLAFVIIIIGWVISKCSQGLRRLVIFSLGWFVLTQLLTINIVPLIWEYSFISVAEHFLYLPMIGVVLAVAALAKEFFPSKIDPQWKVVAAILVITVLCVLTIRQHEAWLSEVGLFKRAAGQEPGLGRVQMLLGKAYQAEGDFSSAIAAYSKARERMMEYQQRAFGSSAQQFYKFFRKDINRGLATSHQALQNYDLAEKYFQEALELMPDDAASHNDFGVLYTVTQQNDLAAIEFGRALALRPDDELFIKNYALALSITGQKDQAVALLKEKIQKNSTKDLNALLQQIQLSP